MHSPEPDSPANSFVIGPAVINTHSLSAPGHHYLTARLADWLLAGPPTAELEEFPLTLLPVTCSFSFLYAARRVPQGRPTSGCSVCNVSAPDNVR